jgi:uncharacterized membrane protein (UPF0127 family)
VNEPVLKIRIADTPSKQSQGLMNIREMPFDEGMLFSFDRPHKLSFWGRNTFIPLDIAFADESGIIRDIQTIEPHNLRPVKSSENCMYAIEANLGFFENHGVKIGDKAVLKGEDSLVFRRKQSSSFGLPSKRAQLMGNEYGFDVQDAEREAEEAARQRYESLPSISPDEIGDILVDNDFESQPDQVVDQPGDIPEPMVPDVDLPEVEPVEDKPQFDNVFDAVDEFAKPTINNAFSGNAMRIAYTTKSGKQIDRDIEPHGSFHADTTGNQILVAYDRTVGGIRAYIMQNIRAFALLEDKFEPKFRVEQ